MRLRPRNAEERVADADFPDCVELQPEVILKQNCLNVPVIFFCTYVLFWFGFRLRG